MAQYDIYKSRNKQYPFFIEVQNDTFSLLNTRLVIPLAQKEHFTITPLTKSCFPIVKIENRQYVLLPHLIKHVLKNEIIDKPVSNASHIRTDIISALDRFLN